MPILTPANRQGERTVIMQPYQNLNSAGLAQELRQVRQDLDAWKARGLKLNMARGSRGAPSWTWSATFSPS